MYISAVDLGIKIDFGNNQPGQVLLYWDNAYWREYLIDGKQVLSQIEYQSLPPGKYRFVDA